MRGENQRMQKIQRRSKRSNFVEGYVYGYIQKFMNVDIYKKRKFGIKYKKLYSWKNRDRKKWGDAP